jgi:hypothetical protein
MGVGGSWRKPATVLSQPKISSIRLRFFCVARTLN